MLRKSGITGVSASVLAAVALASVGLAAGFATDTVSQTVAGKAKGKAVAANTGKIVATRRLTESQYRNTIADIFGPDMQISGRFEPEKREHGLFAIGSTQLSISSGGFEQYYAMAKAISDQSFDAKHRAKVFGEAPANKEAADDVKAAAFVQHYGHKLFRRPLTEAEVTARVALANRGATQAKNYDAGLKLALISLLTAPEFLFRVETAEADPKNRRALRLDGYSKAQRLSYLIWDTAPDDELLAAAANGELHTQAGVDKQVARLVSSPRAEAGARALFSDMMQLDRFETVTKDAAIYPKFSAAVANSAKEQTLKTVIDLLLVKQEDYRKLFTSPDTFIDRSLASIYQVPFIAPSGWMKYKVPDDVDQAGVVTQVTFLSLFSHAGRSSPTLRGVGVNEVFLCQETPSPPANVDFSIVNDTSNVRLKTTRARLLAHAEEETCAGCHNLTDPIGLSLEGFDGLGQRRLRENGELIDVSAEYDGQKWTGAKGLGKVLHDHPQVSECIVRNVYAYGVGRSPDEPADLTYLQAQGTAFSNSGYKFPALVKSVASSPEFFKIVIPPAPEPVTTESKVASLKAAMRLAGGL